MATEHAKPRVNLVLGAGGARGLAHIGVIEVLQERGYEIAAVAGASMGALVGGIHAAGQLPAYTEWAEKLERNDVLRLLDLTLGAPGFIRGDRVIATLRELVGEHRIEDLPLPFVAVATDLATQREVWLQRGPLFDAIRASIAIPLVFTPHAVGGRELVDGGLLAPLPLAATRAFPGDRVIAVDLNGRGPRPFPVVVKPALPEREMFDDEPAAWEGWRERLGQLFQREPKPREAEKSGGLAGTLEQLSRSMDTMHSHTTRLAMAQDPPDLVIKVPRDSAMFYEFWRAKELRELGRVVAEEALREWPVISRLPAPVAAPAEGG